MSKFKIGQALIFRKGSVKLSGRYVVLASSPNHPVKRATASEARMTEGLNMLPKNASSASPSHDSAA
jgi:hypothetical protein